MCNFGVEFSVFGKPKTQKLSVDNPAEVFQFKDQTFLTNFSKTMVLFPRKNASRRFVGHVEKTVDKYAGNYLHKNQKRSAASPTRISYHLKHLFNPATYFSGQKIKVMTTLPE